MFCATVHRQARMGIAAEENKGIGFIIAQQHVVTRLVQLDVVVLKQQRFRLGVVTVTSICAISATSASVLREAGCCENSC
jgi:hypothetical protein